MDLDTNTPQPIWFYTKYPCLQKVLVTTNANLKKQIATIGDKHFVLSPEDIFVVIQARMLEFLIRNFFDDSTDAVVTVPFDVAANNWNDLSSDTLPLPRAILAQAFSVVRSNLITFEFNFMRDIAADDCSRYDLYIPFTIAECNLEILDQKYREYKKRTVKLAPNDSRKRQYLWRMFVIEKVIESISLKTVPFYSVLKKEFTIRNPQIQLRRVSMIENFIIIWCYATGNLQFVEKPH